MNYARCAYLAAFVISLSVPESTAGFYPIEGYETKWQNPVINTTYTARHQSVGATLTVTENTFFDGPVDKTTGKLEFFVNKRKSQEEKLGPMRDLGGLFIGLDKKKRTSVYINVSLPHSYTNHFTYIQKGPAKVFRKVSPTTDDMPKALCATEICRRSSCGNTEATLSWIKPALDVDATDWKLIIKKGRKVIHSSFLDTTNSGDPALPPLRGAAFQGPYLTSLDGSGNVQVDLRIDSMVSEEHSSYRVAFEKIYYFDKRKKQMKARVHYWGMACPRFARLKNDGSTQIISEDFQLEHDCWSDREHVSNQNGGPLQIWQWTKDNQLKNVSRDYPEEIRKHARAALNQYMAGKLSSQNDLIAYVGDLCLLGEEKKALAELKRLETPDMQPLHDHLISELRKKHYLR